MKYKWVYIIIALLVLLPILYMILLQWTAYSLHSPRLAEVNQESFGNKKVIFITRGALQGWRLLLLIQHEKELENYIEILGVVDDNDGPHRLQDVVISNDGKIIAVNSKADNWTYGYDFSTSTAYKLKNSQYWNESNIDDLKNLDISIQKLIESHGGIGKELGRDDIYKMQKDLSWFEWQRWNRLLGSY